MNFFIEYIIQMYFLINTYLLGCFSVWHLNENKKSMSFKDAIIIAFFGVLICIYLELESVFKNED